MPDIIEEVLKLKREGLSGILITAVHIEGSAPTSVGAKLLLSSSGKMWGTIGGGGLEHEALKRAREALGERKSFLQKYSLGEGGKILDAERLGMICGGNITLFFEYIGSADQIFLYGGGHIGQALIYHLRSGSFVPTLIETREPVLRKSQEQWENVEGILMDDFSRLAGTLKVPKGSYMVVATHSHELDYKVLKGIYESQWEPAYIGVVASKKKAETMVRRLREEMGTELDFRSLYMPVGLDLGGQSPDEIALSILSEIQALRNQRDGHKHLRRSWETQ